MNVEMGCISYLSFDYVFSFFSCRERVLVAALNKGQILDRLRNRLELLRQGEDVAAAYAQDFELDPIANRDGWVRISGRRR